MAVLTNIPEAVSQLIKDVEHLKKFYKHTISYGSRSSTASGVPYTMDDVVITLVSRSATPFTSYEDFADSFELKGKVIDGTINSGEASFICSNQLGDRMSAFVVSGGYGALTDGAVITMFNLVISSDTVEEF